MGNVVQNTQEDNHIMNHNFDLENFTKIMNGMIATNDNSYNEDYCYWDKIRLRREYSIEDILGIIKGGDLKAMSVLSNQFYAQSGIYKQLITYYATLLKYSGLLIPTPAYGKSLQDSSIAKRYANAVDFVERLRLSEVGQRIAYKVLINGTYFGVIQTMTKNAFCLMDLPFGYCRTRFKDQNENAIVEFDVRFFDSIKDEQHRDAALRTYPKVISAYYKKYHNGKAKNGDPFVMVPTDIGVAFTLLDARPYFLQVLPSILQYDDSIGNELKREVNEIKKVLVNHIPHLNDGTLLFEPQEVQLMHNGIVGMLKTSNPDVSVVTSYGDISLESTKGSEALANNTMSNVQDYVYTNAAVSKEIFAATGSSSLDKSIRYDIGLMMVLANKISTFVTNIINTFYANGSIQFKYTILPISLFNEDDYVNQNFKLASSGYSFLLPAIAQGLSQRDLGNIKDLENDVLKLDKRLKPLASSYTQSGDSSGENEQAGRPELDDDEKSEKTIENIESKERTGG